jgi:hypothetical protein
LGTVQCPNCKNRFEVPSLKVFGVVPVRRLKAIFLGVFLAVVVIVAQSFFLAWRHLQN